jgi:hypothetical protein
MINASKAFQKILREWGHDVLIQRRLSDDGVYSDRFEKVTTRHITAASRYLASTKEETTGGVIINSDRIYYFEASINPKSGDRIYEELSSGLESQILYVIEECYPVRGKQGKIEFWTVRSNKRKPYELTYAYSNTRSNGRSSICI